SHPGSLSESTHCLRGRRASLHWLIPRASHVRGDGHAGLRADSRVQDRCEPGATLHLGRYHQWLGQHAGHVHSRSQNRHRPEAVTAWPLLLECAVHEEPLTALRRAFLKLAARHSSDLTHVRRLMTLILRTPSLRGRLHNEAAAWQAKLNEAAQAFCPNDPAA